MNDSSSKTLIMALVKKRIDLQYLSYRHVIIIIYTHAHANIVIKVTLRTRVHKHNKLKT